MPAVKIPATEFFVGGKGVAGDKYRIVGSPTAPYLDYAAAETAAKAAVGPPDNYFESAVFEAKVAFRAS